MKRRTIAAAVAAGGIFLAVIGSSLGFEEQSGQAVAAAPCQPSGSPLQAGVKLPSSEAQIRNFKTVIAVGKQMNVPQRGMELAIAVTLVESEGLNVASRKVPESMRYPNDGVRPGDHLSINLFQQQVGMGWFDTVANGMKVEVAARSFYSHLLAVSGWESMGFGKAAQEVQRSAFPFRYGIRELEAKAIYAKYASAAAAEIVPASQTTDCVEPDGPAMISGEWANPLAPYPYTVASEWSASRYHPYLHVWLPHTGIDLMAPAGTKIKAACNGKVTQSGFVTTGGGNQVTIDCGGGIETKYQHQSKIAVNVGQTLKAGQVLGFVGTTGWSTGNHLHFGVYIDGKDVNPRPFMEARGVPL